MARFHQRGRFASPIAAHAVRHLGEQFDDATQTLYPGMSPPDVLSQFDDRTPTGGPITVELQQPFLGTRHYRPGSSTAGCGGPTWSGCARPTWMSRRRRPARRDEVFGCEGEG